MRLSSDRVPALTHDAAFETLLGSMVGRLADATCDAVEPALGRALTEFCRGFELAGAGLLERSQGAKIALTVDACESEPCALRELVEGWPEPELERLFQLLPRSSALLLDPASHDAGFEHIRRALSARSLGTALCIRLELAGVSRGALLLVAPEGGSFTSRLLLRLRLVADTLSIALVLRDRRHRPGELSDEQVREFERSNLLAVIERCGWRLQGERGAARALGLSPSTLRDRMKSFGIQRPR